MKFILDKKAKKHLKDKGLTEIFINPDLDQKAACCGLGSVDLVILTKDKQKTRYKKFNNQGINIYYNPNLNMYLKDDEEITISSFGLGPFRKLYIKNEINSIER
ncbi:Uncharacterised protein [Anaerococcus prevotii]|uniref:FeS cluster biogenesis domain-containing protein n=1 Tax=Anaerococcus prevotii (strain ATCC 9321 / DSM 20548 / JCM 6508 / NCTC 11806 / PC1) TaxID=525919 RepID=C7RGN2_ANAPD|nr:hypothetical protein [Anaerococcus prevotii]ACV28643.1 hypothetical protein Apre_0601 [Anaerococcus prevotii DSM 20548]SUU94205.1 Uncharacterised protein [Anaerococcus prevotii]